MSNSNTSDDQALLARLNALKKSSVNLHDTKPVYDSTGSKTIPIDPAPARALHSDLLDRFKSLNGESRPPTVPSQRSQEDTTELSADEDGKTIEELLAELGPEESWNVPKDEETQIQDLLKSAASALKAPEQSVDSSSDQRMKAEHPNPGAEGGPSKNGHGPWPTKNEADLSEAELDREADDYLAQILDEIKHQPQQASTNTLSNEVEGQATDTARESANPSTTDSMDMPAAPLTDLDLPPSYTEATLDDDLASRFANLGLPSVPTTIKSSSTATATKQPPKGFTDEEIDSWCVICNEDATLRCIGCDGDLYCTSCWLEGHKGEDAGYEERKHKAVQYTKGSKLKKQPNRKTMMGV